MIKSEKGSITVYVLVVMMFFTIVLMGILIQANIIRKNLKETNTSIIDKYQEEVDLVDVIYNEKLEEYEKLNHSDIAEVKWNNNINEQNSTSSATISFYENDLSGISNFKYFVNTSKSFIGKSATEWSTAQTVSSGISANGTLTPLSIQNRKINFIHVLITYSDSHQIEIVSDGLQYNKTVYVISYEYNNATDGNSETSKEVYYNEEYGDLPTPTKSGYIFEGWYLEDTYSNLITATSIVNTNSNHTLYAKWGAE